MLSEIERVLLANWETFGLPGKRPDRFLYILSTEQHWHSKAAFYCLSQSHPTQAVVVKTQKADLHQPFLETEHRHLQALQGDQRLQELRASIPRPLFFGQIAGHPTLIETYMPGVPFSKHTRRREPGLFLQASKWLGDFHERTRRTARPLTAEERDGFFLYSLESTMRAGARRSGSGRFLDRFSRQLEELAGTELPYVFNHNDLCLNNIRFQADQIQVIDWEFSRESGLPLLDLLNLFLFFAMTWKRLGYSHVFRLAFSRGNEVSQLLQRCLRDYCRTLGLSPALLPLLPAQYLVSRIPLLQSIGNVAAVEETLWCLQSIAERHEELEAWSDLGP